MQPEEQSHTLKPATLVMQLIKIPIDAFLRPMLGPELLQGFLWNMSPKSDNYSHTNTESQTTLMIIFLARLSEVGVELASLCWPQSFTG